MLGCDKCGAKGDYVLLPKGWVRLIYSDRVVSDVELYFCDKHEADFAWLRTAARKVKDGPLSEHYE